MEYNYKCKYCGHEIGGPDFEELEEELWGHIQMDHEEVFEELQCFDTPEMLEIAYED